LNLEWIEIVDSQIESNKYWNKTKIKKRQH